MQIMNISTSTFPSSAHGSAEEDATTAWPQCRAVVSGEGNAPESLHKVLVVNSAPMRRSTPGCAAHMVVRQWWVPTARPQREGMDQPVRIQGWDAVPVSSTGTCGNQVVKARSRDNTSRQRKLSAS